jgi:hypothetical protein
LAPLAGGSPHNVRKSFRCTPFIAAVFLTLAQGCFTTDAQSRGKNKTFGIIDFIGSSAGLFFKE